MKKRDVPLVLFAIAAVFFLITAVNLVELGGKKVTGKASAVAMLGLTVLGACDQSVNLTQGWNFISLYAIPSSYNVTDVLQPIDGYYDYIQEWDSSTQDFGIWSRFGQKDFTQFNENKSYFVYLNQNKELMVNGECFGNWTIELVPGWEAPNYVYPYDANVSGEVFYNATFSYMQKWNASAQEFLAYSPLAETNPFDKILLSEGYLLRTEGGTIFYVRA